LAIDEDENLEEATFPSSFQSSDPKLQTTTSFFPTFPSFFNEIKAATISPQAKSKREKEGQGQVASNVAFLSSLPSFNLANQRQIGGKGNFGANLASG
jgi:hypothetical protein